MNTMLDYELHPVSEERFCFAKKLGASTLLVECLVKQPSCHYSKSFRDVWLCCHPLKHRIAEHTHQYGHAGHQGPVEVGSIDD
jgi:hypothetical protein